jgi:hypothetical protein
VNKGKLFAENDVYIDYPFEEVMFRWDHLGRKAYRRFYSKPESPQTVALDNRLLNDAILYGEQISREEYERGNKRK